MSPWDLVGGPCGTPDLAKPLMFGLNTSLSLLQPPQNSRQLKLNYLLMPKVNKWLSYEKCSRCRHDRQKVLLHSLFHLLIASDRRMNSAFQKEGFGQEGDVTVVNASTIRARQVGLWQRRPRPCKMILWNEMIWIGCGSLQRATASGR